MSVAWFVPIGIFIGVYGTLIGAGGGFILVPILVFLFPQDGPSMITASSLAVICANAASGTIAYARMKRISYKTGALFAAASIPGAFIGSALTRFIPRRVFGVLFGGLLMAVAVFLSVTRGIRRRGPVGAMEGSGPARAWGSVRDTVVDREGRSHPLSFNLLVGMGLSMLIGFLATLVGIGGGLIHVPVLTYIFNFPLHIATATSHFVLFFTALTGVVEHILDHTWPTRLLRDACLAAGVIGGAQVGAFLSRKISAPWIVLALAIALGFVGVRLVLTAL
jgi:uncharacterized membrane protein YfcA